MSQTKAQLISDLVQALAFTGTSSAPDNGVYLSAANTLAFNTNSAASPRLTIDSSGRLLVGTASTSADVRLVVQGRTTDANAQGDLLLTRNGNPGGADSGLGQIQFSNDDDIGAAIAASSDAAWTSGSSHPSKLTFSTTLSGASSPTVRMTIKNDGKVGIGVVDPSTNSASGAQNLVIGDANSSIAGITINTGTGSYQGRINFGRGTTDQSYGYILCDHFNAFLGFGVGGDERFRVNSTGRVGIGLSSPGALLHLRDSDTNTLGNAQVKISKGVGDGAAPNGITRQNCYLHLGGSEYDSTTSRGTNGGRYCIGFGYTNGETGTGIPAYIGFQETSTSGYTIGDLIFGTRTGTASGDVPPVRMRLTPEGALRIGNNTSTDSAGFFQIVTDSSAQQSNDCVAYIQHGGSDWDLILDHTYSTGYWLQFKKNNSSAYGWVIESGSGVNYYSASDYRLKDNVQDLNNAIDRLKQLKPRTYTWLSHPGVTVDGFLAHEVQGVVPQAVDGEKDAVNQNGEPVHQGLDVAELVPLLAAALKEAVSKIEILETKVAALENP